MLLLQLISPYSPTSFSKDLLSLWCPMVGFIENNIFHLQSTFAANVSSTISGVYSMYVSRVLKLTHTLSVPINDPVQDTLGTMVCTLWSTSNQKFIAKRGLILFLQ